MPANRQNFRLREPIGFKRGRQLEGLEHKEIPSDEYKKKLREAQLELLEWQRKLVDTKSSVIIVVEGPDAAPPIVVTNESVIQGQPVLQSGQFWIRKQGKWGIIRP